MKFLLKCNVIRGGEILPAGRTIEVSPTEAEIMKEYGEIAEGKAESATLSVMTEAFDADTPTPVCETAEPDKETVSIFEEANAEKTTAKKASAKKPAAKKKTTKKTTKK